MLTRLVLGSGVNKASSGSVLLVSTRLVLGSGVNKASSGVSTSGVNKASLGQYFWC